MIPVREFKSAAEVFANAKARARLLPNVVTATAAQWRARKTANVPPTVALVEYDGRQPGYAEAVVEPPKRPEIEAGLVVRAIRRARGKPVDQPCGFPHDLGCTNQLILGLAIRYVFKDKDHNQVAELCGVAKPDAFFFGMLLDMAYVSEWFEREQNAYWVACNALRNMARAA